MNFDIISMKQRAKGLIKSTKPNPKAVCTVFALLALAYGVVLLHSISIEKYWIMPIAELLYLSFRNSCNFYALKISREEKTSFGDCLSAFKQKPVKIFLLTVIRDILCAVGFCVLFVGIFFPIYWFRFAGYILRDEDIGIFKAMSKSKKMLKGHYVELIKVDVSHLAWYILMLFTLGIASFYVKPYTAIVYAEFYDYLKAQGEF